MQKKDIYRRILKNKQETLDRELMQKETIVDKDDSLRNEIKHYVLLIIVSILYLFFGNFLSQTISEEFFNYNRLLVSIFVLYPLVCCIFGAFAAIFKYKNYSYPQRLLRSILKLMALYFVALAFVFTILEFSGFLV